MIKIEIFVAGTKHSAYNKIALNNLFLDDTNYNLGRYFYYKILFKLFAGASTHTDNIGRKCL